MATRFISSVLLRTLFGLSMVLIFVGCIDHNTDFSIPGGEDSKTPNTFNFATTEQVQLNVTYQVPEGYQVLFEVYAENPLTTDAEGQIMKRSDLEPIVVRMTDGNGKYSSLETIAADHADDLYIYTSCIGVPTLYKTSFKGNVVEADINWDTMVGATSAQTRASQEFNQAPSGYYSMGSWNELGRPNYLDIDGALTLSDAMLTTINKTIPEGGNCPEKYRQSADFVIDDPEGRDAEVKVRFVGGTSGAASAFGYYCYKNGDSKTAIQNARKYIVFPNTKTGIGIKGGECVKLHYIDENGVDRGTVFPSGTKIGWFIINDAFKSGPIKIGSINKAFYSTSSLNSDGRTHTVAFRINDFVVLAFEDWTDNDYNDVQFNVWSNPIEAIVTPDIPVVKPSGPSDDTSIAYQMTYKGILAFEDNWPNKGDYDMNDVVVKYNSVLSYNTKNEVLTTQDTFTTLWSGAQYKNGFAYQMNTERSNVECEIQEGASAWGNQGLDPELSLATVSLFSDAVGETNGNTRTSTYMIKNTFKKPVDHNVLGAAPYNPFIFVHQDMGKNRIEVHLVNHKPTEKANMSLFHTGADLSEVDKEIYYISADSYPFAIHLADAEMFSTKEMVAVDNTYPRFVDWAKSEGKTNKDWYK